MQESRVDSGCPPDAVGIIGGMGPAAGAQFVRLFVEACTELMMARGIPVTDQSYPEHWLAQVPVPDRSAALRRADTAAVRPLEAMKQIAARLGALGARSIAIACNTAHAWHSQLQQAFPDLHVLDGVTQTGLDISRRGTRQAVLLATEGTYASRIYDGAFEAVGVRCWTPEPAERALLMEGIYKGVKAGDFPLARDRFLAVAKALAERHACPTVVLGCTEIPLALQPGRDTDGLTLVDPARVMARALALRAYRAPAGESIFSGLE